jgi:hypothetical protein
MSDIISLIFTIMVCIAITAGLVSIVCVVWKARPSSIAIPSIAIPPNIRESTVFYRDRMPRFIDALEYQLNGFVIIRLNADAPADDPYKGSEIGAAFNRIGMDSKSREAGHIVQGLISDGHLRLITMDRLTDKPIIEFHYIANIDDDEPRMIGHLVKPSYI